MVSLAVYDGTNGICGNWIYAEDKKELERRSFKDRLLKLAPMTALVLNCGKRKSLTLSNVLLK